MKNGFILNISLAGVVLIGAAIAFLSVPFLFAATPNELSRIGAILDALRSPGDTAPDLIVMGNSVVMNGIDAAIIEEHSSKPVNAWNCASTGQNLVEALMFLRSAPDSVNQVWAGALTDELFLQPMLNPSKYDAFRMYGFEPDDRIKGAIKRFESEQVYNQLTTPWWTVQSRARWIFRSAFDTMTRTMLRRDLLISEAINDFRFPAVYTQKLNAQKTRLRLAPWLERRERIVNDATGFHPDAIRLVQAIQEEAAHKGFDFGLFILPDHPALTQATPDSFRAMFEESRLSLQEQSGVPVLDFHTLLNEDEFIDDAHPTRDGAERLSRALAEAL